MSPRASRTAAGLVTSLVLFAGCRQILGIEERELDPLSCERYCELIDEVCAGSKLQFASLEACMGMCSTYPEGTLEDQTGHTLGCRLRLLDSRGAGIESSECAAAGPGGNGVCGDDCESLCTSMKEVCPQNVEYPCATECAALISCGDYFVPDPSPDDPSVQCRLYHISAAAIGLQSSGGALTDSQDTHCPHAIGEGACVVPDPPDTAMCP
jgi:hypothetical protein